MSSVFIRDLSEYRREIDIVEGYYDQIEILINRMTQVEPARIRAWLKREFSEGGRFAFKPPKAAVNVRDPETGDRRRMYVDMAGLLSKVRKSNLVSSPSMTFYLPAKFKRSLLSEFVEEKIAERGAVKKEMLVAEANKEHLKAELKKNEQNAVKTLNNSLSGAHSSKFTILYNKSTHSSLTSTCRSATSYGNANNEKLLAGNRHYWSAQTVINNILATIDLTDFVKFGECMDTYQLHYPTVDETMECIHRSADLYWINGYASDYIRELVMNLTALERAAFVYIGDLYHLRKYNDAMMREFLDKLIQPCDILTVPENEVKIDADLLALVSLLRQDVVGELGSFSNLKDPERNPDRERYRRFLATCQYINETCQDYFLFIREILTTRNVPASIARMPDSLRRVSLVSDTDSTMATLQEWSQWFAGTASGKVADDIADTMIYIATQNIAHLMARMSAQMGVEDKYVFRYSMKNEYKFSSFALTNKAKHYFSLISAKEGVLKEDPELEVKGVALRTSNIPPVVMSEFRNTIRDISLKVSKGEKVELLPLLERIAVLEDNVELSVRRGESTYLKTGQIKTRSAYSKPEQSNYVYYEFWEETFGPKYGSAGEPPFGVVKVSVDLENKTAINRWLERMEDRELAGRLKAWFVKFPKRTFKQLLLPEVLVVMSGIPKEILDVVDFRRIKFNSVEPYYHVLECFSIMMIDDTRSRLVSDFYGTSSEARQQLLAMIH